MLATQSDTTIIVSRRLEAENDVVDDGRIVVDDEDGVADRVWSPW